MDVKDPTKMSFHLLPMKTETNFDVVHHIDLIGSSKKKNRGWISNQGKLFLNLSNMPCQMSGSFQFIQ